MYLQITSDVSKLLVGETYDRNEPVTLDVEEDGLYLATICPINETGGIINITGFASTINVTTATTSGNS